MTGNILAESEWELQRLGKFTSSRIDDLLTPPKDKEAKAAGEMGETAKKYILEKAAEIITGTHRDLSTYSTEWGNMYEAEAGGLLVEMFPGLEYYGKVTPQFFPYTDFSGGSPDGGHKERGLIIEIKCPENPANHVKYCLLESAAQLKKEERAYYHQIQMNMACAAKKWGCDFMDMKAIFASYCPIVNDPFPKLKTIMVYPDGDFIEKLPAILDRAEIELANTVAKLKNTNSASIPVVNIDNPLIHLKKIV